MDLTRLQIFAAVAEHGSFARAADALNYTASAVSQQMARLETEVGGRLLERGPRGVALTAAGELLAGRAAEILHLVAETREELDELHGNGGRAVRVGSFPTATTGYVLAAVQLARDALTGHRVTLRDGEPFALVDLVQDRRLDLAVVFERERQDLGQDYFDGRVTSIEGLVTEWLMDEPFVLIGREGDPLLDSPEALPVEALDGATLIGCEYWPGMTALAATMRERGARPAFNDFVGHDYGVVAGLVAAGEGLAVIPALAAGPALGLVVRPLDPPLFRRHLVATAGRTAQRPEVCMAHRLLQVQAAACRRRLDRRLTRGERPHAAPATGPELERT